MFFSNTAASRLDSRLSSRNFELFLPKCLETSDGEIMNFWTQATMDNAEQIVFQY
jgi:hypothetical protein